jgi:hypothetical protein
LGSEAVGFGRVAWLRLGPVAPGLLTLSRSGEETRALRIGETGQVPEIQVDNHGPSQILLPAHLVLSGGWQTRAVERSVIVQAGGSARVPVKCVEAGRWAPRDDQTARTFEVAERTGVRTRWSTSRSMADQLARHGRFAAEQSTVWEQIDDELTRGAVQSRTRSYEAYLQGVKKRLVGEARRAGVRPPLAANGVALFPSGGGFWIEAYPHPEALAEHTADLLSDLFDEGHDERPAGRPGPLDDDNALLEALWRAPLRPLDPIAGTAGDGFAMADGPQGAAGVVLVVDGAVAHVSFGAAPAGNDVSGDRAVRKAAPVMTGAPVRPPSPRPAERAPVTTGSPGGAPVRPARAAALSSSITRVESALVASAGVEATNDRPRVDLETMRGVFGRARDLLPEGPPARDRVMGYRLVRVLDRNISWVDIRISGDGYAVLGSHDRCDLVLSNDAGVWLRHLAALCVRLEDDSVGLRLIDLKTDLPFFLDDDTPRWSVLARGPFAIRLGRHVVCGFPIGASEQRGSAPAGVGAGGIVPAENGGAQRPPTGAPPAPRPPDAQATGILDTGTSLNLSADARSVPAPQELSSFVPSAPVSQIQDLLGPSASPDHIRVTLERGGMGASVELPTDSLDAGVLLGRALNCFDGGLRRIFCEAISRAHVLLVRDREGVYAFDLCSTNGTRVAGQRIRRYRLSDAGSTLELGKKVVFRWHRRE